MLQLRKEFSIVKRITNDAPCGLRGAPEGPKAAGMHPGTGGRGGLRDD